MLNGLNQYKQSIRLVLKTTLSGCKSTNDDILQLINPLILCNYEKKTKQYSLTQALQTDPEKEIGLVSTKMLSKSDKRTKKKEKDQTQDKEWNTSKFKPKKKGRSKIKLEEDFESVKELFENSDADLIVQKTSSKPAFSFITKQKVQSSETKRKLKQADTSEKNITPTKPIKLVLTHPITLEELSTLCRIPIGAIIKSLFKRRILITANQSVDPLTAQKIGAYFGIEVSVPIDEPVSYRLEKDVNEEHTCAVSRPPIVAVMGHLNHGKTALLDTIRNTQLAQQELGKITQKIGAYEVTVNYKNGSKKITFLDTPGHEAFYGMRSRSISISDIVVLVVSADEGICSQTLEAIKQATAIKVPVIVAISKIDKGNTQVENIKKELATYGLVPEEWGGTTPIIYISALQRTNINILLDTVLFLAETLQLQGKLDTPAQGFVLESNLDKTKGAIASLIIQEGILNLGDTVIIDNISAKIRGMANFLGDSIKEAYPSSPVTIWGLPKVSALGTRFHAFKNEKDAKLFICKKKSVPHNIISGNYISIGSGNKEPINLTIKADTQGSCEAIISSVYKLNTDTIQIKILQASAGDITETDLKFATTSKSHIIAFNTTCPNRVKKLAKNINVKINEFNIIYDILNHIQTMIDEKVGPQTEQLLTGSGFVKSIFPLAKSFVAGVSIVEGKIYKISFVHVVRDNEIIYKGYIDSLKKVREDVTEVSQGSDCGIFITGFDLWKPGDMIKAFELIPKKKSTFLE